MPDSAVRCEGFSLRHYALRPPGAHRLAHAVHRGSVFGGREDLRPISLPRMNSDSDPILIPRIFHTIWLGRKPLPDHLQAWGESWLHHHPGWEHRHWTDNNLPSLRNAQQFADATSMAQKADILRYEVVAQFGGVYIDTDFECFANIEPLLEGVRAFTGLEQPARPAIGILGSVPEHPLFEKVLEMIPQRWPYRGNILWETGPSFFACALREWAGEEPEVEDVEVGDTGKSVAVAMPDGVLLFQPWVFYPYYFNETWVPEAHPDAFAAHHWEGSWKKEHGGAHAAVPLPETPDGPKEGSAEIFDTIYREGRWAEGGAAPLSGPGSSAKRCEPLCRWIDELRPASTLDLGCGDFTWSETSRWIRERKGRYEGWDASMEIVRKNWERFPDFDFSVMDFCAGPVAVRADLILVKDVACLLNDFQVCRLLDNLDRSEWQWLVLSHHPEASNAHRVLDHYCFSRINLYEGPFSLPAATSTFKNDKCVELAVYRRSDWPDNPTWAPPPCPRWKAFVIGLRRYAERWAGALKRVKQAGDNFEMVCGVDAKAMKPEALVRADYGWPLSPGEIGCYLAHVEVLRRIVDYDLDFGVVLEDDFQWIGNGARRLDDLMRWLPSGADHVQLHSFKEHFYPCYKAIERVGLFNRVSPTNVLTVGYIISRRLAAHMLEFHSQPDMPIDHRYVEFSFDKSFMFFDLERGIVDVDWSSGSTIEWRGDAAPPELAL